MFKIWHFIKMAYGRKMLHIHEQQWQKEQEKRHQAEEEQKQKELEGKRSAAYEALNVPPDADRYLDSEEQREFGESVSGALDACVSGDESYRQDGRVIRYSFFRDKVEHRRKEEQGKTTAAHEATTYNRSLNTEIRRVRSLLRQRAQNPEELFEKSVGDTRYAGQDFSRLLSREEAG